MAYNYNEKDSSQPTENSLENILGSSNDTVTTRSAYMLKCFVYPLRHIMDVYTYKKKLKWTILVISLQNNVWEKFNVAWKFRTESELNNQLVLHLHDSVDRNVSTHLESNCNIVEVYFDILRTQRYNNKLL
jgi:hypothetical protein